MSQKKKRRPNSSAAQRARAQADKLADKKDRDQKRMNPIARNLLFGDLVFLALCQILESKGVLPRLYSGMGSLAGLVVLFVALWFQFGKKDDHNSGWSGNLRR